MMEEELLGLRGFESPGNVRVFDAISGRLKRIEDMDGNILQEFRKPLQHRRRYYVVCPQFVKKLEPFEPFDFKLFDKLLKKAVAWLDKIEAERDVNWALTNLYKRVRELESKLASRNYSSVESKRQRINIVLTDEEQLKLCLECSNFKVSKGILRCHRQKCKY